MGLNLRDAIAEVTAPGELFEVTERQIDDVVRRVFVHSPATLRDIFDGARGAPETFLVYEGEEWSFARVMEAVDEMADALVHRFHLGHGDRVGIAMRNIPEWVVAFAAIVSVGGVAVSLNAWWTSDELEYALNDADVTILIADPERMERALDSCRRRGTPIILARGDASRDVAEGVAHWRQVVESGAAMPRLELSGEDDATILYTSGTTGRPKGAVATHDAICQTLMAFSAGIVIEDRRRGPRDHPADNPTCFILIVPLFHVTGCVPVMLSCFAWHFKLVMMRRWDPEVALRLIERHRVTNVVGVPTQAWDLVNSARLGDFDTSSLVTVGGGGAPAAPALVARVEESFSNGRPNLAYGMTETNAYGPQNYGDDYQERPASTGQTPTVVMDVEIRDEAGRRLPAHEVGEIWVSGPTLFRGYWRQSSATADALVAGWLRTGDVGYLDEEGFLYVEDRRDDMILRGGDNVYCAEVEAVLYDHPAIREAAVCGLADARLGEVVAAVVLFHPGATLDEVELTAFVATRLAAYKVPTRWAFTAEPLARNAAGKIAKNRLGERYFASSD